MKFKPRAQWKLNCSVTEGRGHGGQIRWKGAGSQPSRDRFLVIVERNRGDEDRYIKKSETIEGTQHDAASLLERLIAEADLEAAPVRKPAASPVPSEAEGSPSPTTHASTPAASALAEEARSNARDPEIPVPLSRLQYADVCCCARLERLERGQLLTQALVIGAMGATILALSLLVPRRPRRFRF